MLRSKPQKQQNLQRKQLNQKSNLQHSPTRKISCPSQLKSQSALSISVHQKSNQFGLDINHQTNNTNNAQTNQHSQSESERPTNTQRLTPEFFLYGPGANISTNFINSSQTQSNLLSISPNNNEQTPIYQRPSLIDEHPNVLTSIHNPSTRQPFMPLTKFPQSKLRTKEEIDVILNPPQEQLPQTKKLQRQVLANWYPNVFTASANQLKQYVYPLKGNWNKHYFAQQNDTRDNNGETNGKSGDETPLVLELGCGWGQYVVGLANLDRENQLKQQQPKEQTAIKATNNQLKKYYKSNYIGLEQKGSRLFVGATQSIEQNLTNVGFICGTFDFITLLFAKNEVDQIWLTFPDQNFHSNSFRHITSIRYIPRFHQILKPDGIIHLKTDQDEVYNYTIEQIKQYGHIIIEQHSDLYQYFEKTNEIINDEDINNDNVPPTSYINSKQQHSITSRDILKIQTYYEQLWAKKGKTIKYLKFKLNPELDYKQLFIDNYYIHETDDDKGDHNLRDEQKHSKTGIEN